AGRHREASGVRSGDHLFWVGASLVLEARAEAVRRVQCARCELYPSLTFLAEAFVAGGSAVHGHALLLRSRGQTYRPSAPSVASELQRAEAWRCVSAASNVKPRPRSPFQARSWKKNTTAFTNGSISAMPPAIATEPVKT